MKHYFRVLLILSLLLHLSASTLWAFGGEGHKIVCAIAQKLLSKEDEKEVERLSKLYKTPDGDSYLHFTTACNFADRARIEARKPMPGPGWGPFNNFSNWHFLNVPRTTKMIPDTDCGNDCVLHGIKNHFDRLRNKTLGDQARAEALMFLGHWVGDIHQPLHISYRDDLGGNEIQPITGDTYFSDHLHAVWDTGILTNARGQDDWWTYAGKLKNRITPDMQAAWLAANPLRWAQESYDITTTKAVLYCDWVGTECRSISGGRKLESPYQTEFKDDIELRLQMAGVRLADLIRKALHPTP